MDVNEALQRLVRVPENFFFGKVVSVSGMECEVDPQDESANWVGVNLRANEAENDLGFTIYPKVDSLVLCLILDKKSGSAAVLHCTEIEKIEINFADDFYLKLNADKTVTLKCTDFVINDGNNGGLIIIQNLVNKLNALENKHNTFETAFNNFINTVFNTHVHPTSSPGAPTGPSAVPGQPSTAGQIAPVTAVADLENPHVKH